MGHSEVTMEILISQEHRGGIWNEICKRLVTTRYLCQLQDFYSSGTNLNIISEMINY